jgi:hypothetical protein
MTRSERWAKPVFASLTVVDSEKHPALLDALKSAPERPREPDSKDAGSLDLMESIYKTSKEMILKRNGNLYEMAFICYAIDASSGLLRLEENWTMGEMTENNVKISLATALVFDVPVYPEDAEIAEDFTRIYGDLMQNGLTANNADASTRLRYAGRRGVSVDDDGNWKLFVEESVAPADVMLARARAAARELRLAEAESVLMNLRSAINGLERLLERPGHEDVLQEWLTRNPILFGLHYKQVKPQFRLGAEYVMDYALEHVSGNYDLVEIERKHSVLNRS